ncbi:sensor histidine kinase [Streptomyces kanamyceticus]|uniref:sensor histidine kinase n=1 Tax=Streptomyces kanamyceticus TaxID=1967 RepID=UPI00123E02FA|nr:histidine kinase [Streptomyces kanamyceticus]
MVETASDPGTGWAKTRRRVSEYLHSRTAAADALLFVLLMVAPAVAMAFSHQGAVESVVSVGLIAAGVATSRRAPFVSLMAVTAFAPLYVAIDTIPLGMSPAVAMVVLGWLAGHRMPEARPATIGFAVVALLGLALAAAFGNVWSWPFVTLIELLAILPWWAGHYGRMRAEVFRAGWERADHLEREQRIIAEQVRLRERARIAHDMHDSLGHELSLLALQAGALEMAGDLSERHRAGVAQLRATAITATELLHDVIGLLRDDTDDEPARLEPASESVTELVARAKDSGVPVTLRSDGTLDGLPQMTERAAYRVVQEMLTNAMKHAPGRPVLVHLEGNPDELDVTVSNELPEDGAHSGLPSGGRGLLGLQERVRLAGGKLRIDSSGGVFSATARLPRHAPLLDDAAADDVRSPSGEPDSESANQLLKARNGLRRRLKRMAMVPVVLAVGTGLALIGVRTYTVMTTAISAETFERIEIGESEADLAGQLPESSLDKPSDGRAEQLPAPPGSTCRYYGTSRNVLDATRDLFRLCFDDGALVAKDRLRALPQR